MSLICFSLICFSSITNEAGASIYSVSPEAVKEMPDMDPNLRSAGMLAYILIFNPAFNRCQMVDNGSFLLL